MPDPNWSVSYMTNQSPEGNSFALVGDGGLTSDTHPSVNAITGGAPADRRVEISPGTGGDAIFTTTTVPGFDRSSGATGEIEVACSGAGYAGFEITFPDAAVVVTIGETTVDVHVPGSTVAGFSETTVSNAARTKWRVTFDSSNNVKLFREGVQVGTTLNATTTEPKSQRFLWWGESGGLQSFYDMHFFVGGAVEPG